MGLHTSVAKKNTKCDGFGAAGLDMKRSRISRIRLEVLGVDPSRIVQKSAETTSNRKKTLVWGHSHHKWTCSLWASLMSIWFILTSSSRCKDSGPKHNRKTSSPVQERGPVQDPPISIQGTIFCPWPVATATNALDGIP